MTQEHRCTCDHCSPIDPLPASRLGPGHLSERWIDQDFLGAKAYLNGEHVELCIEALPGPEGYIITYKSDQAQGAHMCRSCSPTSRAVTGNNAMGAACRVLKRGRVRVVIDGVKVYE